MIPRIVPYLREEEIERNAESLLAGFEQDRDVAVTCAIPIEDIVEKYLKLRIEFDDMHQVLGVPRSGIGREPDIIGAIFFDERRIVIDESLDPVENPTKEGRYRFTLAHEGGGHWRLHRGLFAGDPSQMSLFDNPAPLSIVCRSSRAKEPVEWQADFYASCLLMPRKLVTTAWSEMFQDRHPRVIQRSAPIADPLVEISFMEYRLIEVDVFETVDEVLERIALPLAKQFLVSPIAMRIRLEKLGLLRREKPRHLILAGNV